jgi:hypothetical protein
MSASMLAACLVLMGVCCWLLVVALLLPAQGLCANNTARYSLLVCLTASTRKTSMHTYIRALAGFTTQLVSSRCLQAVLNTVCTGFVQHAITARYSLQHLFDGSNPSE